MTTQTAARTRAAQKRTTTGARRGRAAAAESTTTGARRGRAAAAESTAPSPRRRAEAPAEKRTAGRRRPREETAERRSTERRRETERERQATQRGRQATQRGRQATQRGRQATQRGRQAAEQKPSPDGARGIDLPVIGHVELPVPRVTSRPAQALWLGGLAGVALLGMIEWPVAAAIAAGTWIAEKFARTVVREGMERPAGQRG